MESSSTKKRKKESKDNNKKNKPKDRIKGKKAKKIAKDNISKIKDSLKVHNRNEKTEQSSSLTKPSIVRKRVDPETAKYFSEISNLFESNTIDLEERSTICGNALEETRGKELELATDSVISRTIQNLLESCEIDQLCGFLRGCSDSFHFIATDRSGSHVAETAIKSLAKHLQDEGSYSYIDDTLSMIYKVVATDSVSVMQSQYGSHVLRSLLCLCKGVPLDRLEEFHTTKRSNVLAERFNTKLDPSNRRDLVEFENGFASVFKSLVREMLNHAKYEIGNLRTDKFSSFVLQTVLKLSVGDDEELSHIISILLNYHEKKTDLEQVFIDSERKQEIIGLIEETASSHLLEVIIEVAPEELYDKLLREIFIGSLFEISSHHCGNFVVQALISSVRTKDQMNKIWEELGPKTKELLELGKSGVVASVLAACRRLETNRRECCKALAEAVNSDTENNNNLIIPRILYIESYMRDKSSWQWPTGQKMNILGCLMLQTIFKYPKQYIRAYVDSIVSMDDEHVSQTTKDPGGARVIESFLGSDTATKLKLRLIAKLKGSYGELAMNGASSYTVEKCFGASNISLKEIIARELLNVRSDLSKTRHGFHLLKKLDIDRFARQPEQWKMSQKSKESAYREFQAVFGESSNKKHKPNDDNLDDNNNNNNNENYDKSNKTVHSDGPSSHETSMAELGFPTSEQNIKKQKFAKFSEQKDSKNFVRRPGEREATVVSELAELASKSELSEREVRKLFNATMKNQNQNQRAPFVKNKRKR